MILRKDLGVLAMCSMGNKSSTCSVIRIRVDSGLGAVESIYYYVLVEIVIMSKLSQALVIRYCSAGKRKRDKFDKSTQPPSRRRYRRRKRDDRHDDLGTRPINHISDGEYIDIDIDDRQYLVSHSRSCLS